METTKTVQYGLVGFQLLVLGWFVVMAFSHVANGDAGAAIRQRDWFNPAVESFPPSPPAFRCPSSSTGAGTSRLTMNEETKGREETAGRAATDTVLVIVVIYMTVAWPR